MQKKGEDVAHAEDGIRLRKLKNSGRLRNSPPTRRASSFTWSKNPTWVFISLRSTGRKVMVFSTSGKRVLSGLFTSITREASMSSCKGRTLQPHSRVAIPIATQVVPLGHSGDHLIEILRVLNDPSLGCGSGEPLEKSPCRSKA
jgi:hypothetical protein